MFIEKVKGGGGIKNIVISYFVICKKTQKYYSYSVKLH